MTRRVLAITTLLTGCAVSLGPAALISTDAEVTGVKLVRRVLQGPSCRVSVLGVPVRAGTPALGEAVAQILAADPEGNVVTRAEVTWSELVTGIYNRRCVEVRGDLARMVPTLRLPAAAGHAPTSH
ncbi:MAG: hypothetical protein E6J68_03420 [Deltaproteobacteria bacterium]|nr:MAG: hypothetical protein E6J68_03420 [Deltaproteobacteria bacterium]